MHGIYYLINLPEIFSWQCFSICLIKFLFFVFCLLFLFLFLLFCFKDKNITKHRKIQIAQQNTLINVLNILLAVGGVILTMNFTLSKSRRHILYSVYLIIASSTTLTIILFLEKERKKKR